MQVDANLRQVVEIDALKLGMISSRHLSLAVSRLAALAVLAMVKMQATAFASAPNVSFRDSLEATRPKRQ